MPREVQDHWFREAKRLGWRSRAAFKLTEIDDKRKILVPKARVLDLGCAPGSWLQVAAKRVGTGGLVVGVDLQPVTGGFKGAPVHVIKGDAFQLDGDMLAEIGLEPDLVFDVILSDMAPATTGQRDTDHYGSMRLCDLVLTTATGRLKAGGNLVMKTFEGPGSRDLVDRMKSIFQTVRPAKPKASRSNSREMFLVGMDRNADVSSQERHTAAPGGPPPPTSGWGD
ncbi:MAG: RlmE family RNA methyltransferase [Phycisphaerales bacterium]|nr:RlmE family RNA methyltransferase [Phycisphaerales bacterium]